tara:strand:- start:8211 stop:9371 length:1161 start_codon:yes stop_codon:yes gene_type:complete
MSHSFFSSFGQTFFIGFYGIYIMQDFSLSNTEYGSLYAAVTLCSSLSLSYFGELMDRSDFQKISLLIAGGLGLSALGMAFTEDLVILALVLFTLRLFGQGLSNLHAQTLMAKAFTNNRGKALALSNVGQPIGEAILPLLLVQPMLHNFDWQSSWLLNALLIFIIFPALILYLGKNFHAENKVVRTKSKNKAFRRLQILKDPAFFLLIPTAVANAFLLTAIFFNIQYIVEEKSWAPALVGTGFLCFGLTRALIGLYSGSLIDRFSEFDLVKFYLTPLILALCSLLIPIPQAGIYLFFVFCGISVGFSTNLFTSIWTEIYGTKNLGSIKGLAGTVAVLSTALSPPIIGWMMDQAWSLKQIVYAMLVYLAISYLLLLKHPRISILHSDS